MSHSEDWDDEESTALFDTRQWEALIDAPTAATAETKEPTQESWEEEATRGLDLSALPPVAEDVDGSRSAGSSDDGEAEGSTMLLDGKALEAKLGVLSAEAPIPGVVTDRSVAPFDFAGLERVSRTQYDAAQAVGRLLPPGKAMGRICERLAKRLEEVVGQEHRVRWRGLGVAAGESSQEGNRRRLWRFSGGRWTWARLSASPHRLVVGIHQGIARQWAQAIIDEGPIVDDHFEFGVMTFVIAEFAALLCGELGWPPFSWAVNPQGELQLGALLPVGQPLAVVAFDICVGAQRGPLHLVLPAATVAGLCGGGGDVDSDDGNDDGGDDTRDASGRRGWWKGLVGAWPLVVGSVALSGGELSALDVGDVVVLGRHGVADESVIASSCEDGARWMISDQQALSGQLRSDGSGRWQFILKEEQMVSNNEAIHGTGDLGETREEGEDGPALDVEMASIQVQLEVQLGQVAMALGDLSRLRKGQLIDCEKPLGSPVELTVKNAVVGHGELVNLDGRLGVRILRMGGTENLNSSG